MRVAFLGPAGTFTDEALRASAPGDVEEVEFPTVHETVMAVQRGDAELAVVPIENSLEGGVAATLDALAGEAESVRIAAEVVHPISHCLVAAEPLELADVERVISHPQATAQCAAFLRERLPAAERLDVGSTAEAVRQVVGAGRPWAALASRLAAELYGAEVLAEGVEDRPDNRTRFVWLRSDQAPAALRRRGAAEDVDRLLGRRRRVARLAGAGVGRARGPRGEHDPHRVAAPAGPPRALHVLLRPRGRRGRAGGRGGARRRRRDTSKGCAFSAPTQGFRG